MDTRDFSADLVRLGGTMTRFVCTAVACAAFLLTGCIFDRDLKHDYGVLPERLDDGWDIATPENVGLPKTALDRIHETLLREDRFVGSLGMLIVKDGKLVWETYLRSPADRDHYHHIQSVTKSVTSLVFGIAHDKGFFPSLDETVSDLFPDEMKGLDPVKRTITLDDLLTMSAGFDFPNVDFSIEMWTFSHSDPLRYILEKPLSAHPGERFGYTDADPQIVGYALERRTGFFERTLADRWLFRSLDITDYFWDAGPDDGVTMAAHGLHLRPRDLAKLGELVLEGGTFRGRRVISSDYIRRMTAAQVTSDVNDSSEEPFRYGFYWWIVPGGASAWGNGGQFVMVVPDRHMVLVHIALPDTADMDGSRLRDFVDLVAPLLKE